eukprot:CAMPEP_0196723040 /NCGR_PEP_ID=MMETSP1091-20130531/5231_1 /TAXON_ID=302021 /ORGANISM="Rhodomonas sp., Strain CCMP768" /LENGTH=59 /DNA_ID=CAMNT_0042064865 /DNA_START=72 /DNA_END=248 /DNA_ORIENTATION=+
MESRIVGIVAYDIGIGIGSSGSDWDWHFNVGIGIWNGTGWDGMQGHQGVGGGADVHEEG